MNKNPIQYKQFLLIPVVLLISFLVMLIACSKDKSQAEMYTTSGNASGDQENPPTGSSGSGTLTGTYHATTNVWQYSINWTGLSSAASAVEIHGPASVGVNGNLMFALSITTPGMSGSASGSVTLTAQQEADMLAGKCYYTILSATHVTGEIRGQITATAK